MELNEVKIHAWIVRLSVAVGIIVGILSWRNGVTLGWLIFRAALSIALIYLLCSGSVALFLKNGSDTADDSDTADAFAQLHTDSQGKGSILDIALGDDDNGPGVPPGTPGGPAAGKPASSPSPGQVDASLHSRAVSSEQQAEIVRRMGWEEKE